MECRQQCGFYGDEYDALQKPSRPDWTPYRSCLCRISFVQTVCDREDYFLLFYPRKDKQFESEKIVVPYRSKTNKFWYSNSWWYAASDVYFITNKLENISIKYTLSLLNSKLYYLWLYNKGKRKWETLELFATPLSQIPIKKITQEQQKPFIDLVEQILEITKNEDYLERDDLKWKVKVLESRIDDMVYDLYDLSKEEIELVEDSLK